MSTLAELKNLEERYPFTELELEILLRGHKSILDESNEDSFVAKLALGSPYSHFMLPGDEMRRRVDIVENKVLPMGFSSQFRAAISADPFVNYANQGEELSFERFLEGIADTGRRGPDESARILYDIIPDPTPEELINLSYRLSIAADVLVKPNLEEATLDKLLKDADKACAPIVKSLQQACKDEKFSKSLFLRWADHTAPMLSTTLSSFTHNLIFHEEPYPTSRVPYVRPFFDHASDIFDESGSYQLFPLSVTSFQFNGKYHRLYSTESDGKSFNRLEWSLLGYTGPTLLVIRTQQNATLGAFSSAPWKDSSQSQGDSGCFLLQIDPTLKKFLAIGKENHFRFCHSAEFDGPLPGGHAHTHGLGFGGTVERPRLFIPEDLEECNAGFWDRTYEQGELLPSDSLDKFEIKFLEVWGVGGEERITKGLRDRAEHRERTDTTLFRMRRLTDKTQILHDLQTGLIPNKEFEKIEREARGSVKFVVDDKHGGYKMEE